MGWGCLYRRADDHTYHAGGTLSHTQAVCQWPPHSRRAPRPLPHWTHGSHGHFSTWQENAGKICPRIRNGTKYGRFRPLRLESKMAATRRSPTAHFVAVSFSGGKTRESTLKHVQDFEENWTKYPTPFFQIPRTKTEGLRDHTADEIFASDRVIHGAVELSYQRREKSVCKSGDIQDRWSGDAGDLSNPLWAKIYLVQGSKQSSNTTIRRNFKKTLKYMQYIFAIRKKGRAIRKMKLNACRRRHVFVARLCLLEYSATVNSKGSLNCNNN